MTKNPKTLPEHTEYCLQMARLKLWFLWHHAHEHPDEKPEFTMRWRTNIIGLTRFKVNDCATEQQYARPEWQVFVKNILHLYVESEHRSNSEEFEESALEILHDEIVEEAKVSFKNEPVPPNGLMGALSYDPPVDDQPDRVHYHISNPLQPASIFDDPSYLPNCFLALMDDAEKKYGVSVLKTGTWLNSHPVFQKNLSEEYRRNMGPEQMEIRWGGGFWGQFMNAQGCFNAKYAQRFRETGKLPYYRRSSYSSFESMRKHLNELLKKL